MIKFDQAFQIEVGGEATYESDFGPLKVKFTGVTDDMALLIISIQNRDKGIGSEGTQTQRLQLRRGGTRIILHDFFTEEQGRPALCYTNNENGHNFVLYRPSK